MGLPINRSMYQIWHGLAFMPWDGAGTQPEAATDAADSGWRLQGCLDKLHGSHPHQTG